MKRNAFPLSVLPGAVAAITLGLALIGPACGVELVVVSKEGPSSSKDPVIDHDMVSREATAGLKVGGLEVSQVKIPSGDYILFDLMTLHVPALQHLRLVTGQLQTRMYVGDKSVSTCATNVMTWVAGPDQAAAVQDIRRGLRDVAAGFVRSCRAFIR